MYYAVFTALYSTRYIAMPAFSSSIVIVRQLTLLAALHGPSGRISSVCSRTFSPLANRRTGTGTAPEDRLESNSDGERKEWKERERDLN